MAEYKVLIYGLGEQYNRNFNIIRYFDMTGQFRMIGVTARHTPDAVKLDGYPVIKYEEICNSGTVISASFPITAGAERSAIRWE